MMSKRTRDVPEVLSAASTPRVRRWVTALACLWAASCAIEGDEACDKNQVYKAGGDVIDYAVCVCDEARGYVFDTQRGYGCKRCPDGQTAMDGKCVGDMPDSGAAQNDGSSQGEPTGVGEPCSSAADCEGFDANYCVPVMNVCAVDKCATGENSCGSGTVCCDFSALLAGMSICLPEDQLEGENCPMGGVRVEQ